MRSSACWTCSAYLARPARRRASRSSSTLAEAKAVSGASWHGEGGPAPGRPRNAGLAPPWAAAPPRPCPHFGLRQRRAKRRLCIRGFGGARGPSTHSDAGGPPRRPVARRRPAPGARLGSRDRGPERASQGRARAAAGRLPCAAVCRSAPATASPAAIREAGPPDGPLVSDACWLVCCPRCALTRQGWPACVVACGGAAGPRSGHTQQPAPRPSGAPVSTRRGGRRRPFPSR